MPLDPQVRQYLEQFAALGIPPLNQMSLEEIRALSVAIPGEPDPISRREDRTIAGLEPDVEIPIRLYWPLDADGKLPGLVFSHGGGWVIGTLDNYDSLCHLLANAGRCVVVSVDYRLAPEHRFPAAVEDAHTATVWVGKHAEELSIDPDRIVVGGDSAGGNLAAATCLMARDRNSVEIAAQVLVYPITDFSFDRPSYEENADGYFLTRDSMKWFWEQYLPNTTERADPRCSPLRAESLADLPPAFVLTTRYDVLRDEGMAYADRLEESGVAVTRDEYDSMIHGFLRRTDIYDKANQAVRRIGAFVRDVSARQTT